MVLISIILSIYVSVFDESSAIEVLLIKLNFRHTNRIRKLTKS